MFMVTPRGKESAQQRQAANRLTQIGRGLRELGIGWIPATPNDRRARLPEAEVARVGPIGPFLLRVAEKTPKSGNDSFHD